MTSTLQIDTEAFHRVFRELATRSSRELSEVTNSRMSFVIGRAYNELKPPNAAGERARIREYLSGAPDRPQRRVGPTAQRIYLILQSRNRRAGNRGLTRQQMKAAVTKFKQRAQGSVGYLAAPAGKAVRQLARFASKGSPVTSKTSFRSARALTHPAEPGIRPEAKSDMSLAVGSGQTGKVDHLYQAAFQKAFAGELVEMERHLAQKMKALGAEA